MQKKERAYLQAPTLYSHFGLPLLPSYFCISISSTFSCHLLLLKQKKRKKTLRKNNHRKEKKCREGRELTFKLPLCPLTFGSYFYPLTFDLLFQAFSPNIFFFSNINNLKKNTHKKGKKCKEGKALTFLLLLLHLG